MCSEAEDATDVGLPCAQILSQGPTSVRSVDLNPVPGASPAKMLSFNQAQMPLNRLIMSVAGWNENILAGKHQEQD